MSFYQPISLLFTLLMLAGCAGHTLNDYAERSPTFIPEAFFQGPLVAHGVVKNRSGEAIRHFDATIDASWQGGIGTLAERFTFDDGEVQYRNWTLTPTNQGSFDATAGDVKGIGKGQFQGNALNLKYTLMIDYNDSKLAVNVDDWMWLVDKNVVMNESTLRKWGFKVGSVQLVIRKLEE
ncbi:DUF3833 domain-containing protein [Gilvimarinus sp. 2_MG-2023]|uniref:DUF3833 domain-containing protein n=1 Tax=Gilvimarinus sp. 2_MG-2023 TaxID=3062666 RepID=UPI0026E1D7D0|nr:DUF3833 domain-containing protein [Gilvimarinus sp. 2_MG-2023]MDO6571595.1 DUF3833 domain-containing protein [Gilvimarinus sp. 2_MG-2023]